MQFTPAATTWDGLVRPRYGRKIGGVCAAFAARFGWDVALVRVMALLLAIFTGIGFLAYIVLWIVLPEEPLYLPSSANSQTTAP